MKKPFVICHMASTINGKIIGENWKEEPWAKDYSGLFEKYHDTFDCEAWILGRVSLEKDFSGGVKPELVEPAAPISREPFIGNKQATSFAVGVDSKGKLGWNSNEIGGDHLIALLTEDVSDAYLHYLQGKKISYIFAGNTELDFHLALEQLSTHFPIKTLMLEGGGHLNGSFLNEGLVDELSVLIMPIADGTPNTTTTFEISEHISHKPVSLLKLKDVKQVDHGTLWVRYSFR